MMQLPSDRTMPLLGWLLLLAMLGFLSKEEFPVLRTAQNKTFDLNHAELADLMMVPRLSIKVAIAILEERERRGGFKKIDELRSVPGVGPKTIENLLKLSRVEP